MTPLLLQRRGLLLLAVLLLGSETPVGEFKLEEGFVALFNGTDLSGWEYAGDRHDRVCAG